MRIHRRTFLAAATAAMSLRGATRLPIKKALYIGMLPKGTYAERFQIARDAGFEEIECATVESQTEADEIRKAAEATKLRIHSVMNQAHWKFPLSSSDPSVVVDKASTAWRRAFGTRSSGRRHRTSGAAVVNPQTSYQDAWTRSQQQIRKLLPLRRRDEGCRLRSKRCGISSC